MAKKALTEQEIAALAAGASIEASADTSVEVSAEAADVLDVDPAPEAAAEVADEQVAEPAKVDTSAEAVQLLMGQLQTKDDTIVQYGIKVAKLEEKLAGVEASHGALCDIALKSLNNMRIALGGSAAASGAFAAADLVAEHARVSEQFVSKFKVGGIAAVGGDESGETVKKPSFVATNVTQAQIRAIHGK